LLVENFTGEMLASPQTVGNIFPVAFQSHDRARVLNAWRGYNVAAAEKTAANKGRVAGSIVSQVMGGLGLDRRRAEAEIGKVWNNLIDPQITAHAQPTGLNKGTLFVSVDSSVWLDEIVRYRRKEILDRLQNSFGKETIVRISFRVG
jgi:hypothetical protein